MNWSIEWFSGLLLNSERRCWGSTPRRSKSIQKSAWCLRFTCTSIAKELPSIKPVMLNALKKNQWRWTKREMVLSTKNFEKILKIWEPYINENVKNTCAMWSPLISKNSKIVLITSHSLIDNWTITGIFSLFFSVYWPHL